MATKLREQSIDALVENVEAMTGSMGDRKQAGAIAALAARCTIDLVSALDGVQGMIFTAKRQLVDRMDEATKELAAFRGAIATATSETSDQTRALVFWTKALVFVTVAYTVITGGLLFVALRNVGGLR